MCNARTMSKQPTWIGTTEAARRAGVSVATVTREVARGNLSPIFKSRGMFLFDPDEVQQWADSRKDGAA